MKSLVILIASVGIAIGRLLIPGHDVSWPGTYEALAHIFVGMLLYACFTEPEKHVRRFALWCLVAITVLEVVMFMRR